MTGPVETIAVELDVDIAAHECAAGLAIDSHRGAVRLAARVEPDDFYDKRLWRIVQAGADCPAMSADERIERIRAATGEPWIRLRQLSKRPRLSLTDERGHYAHDKSGE